MMSKQYDEEDNEATKPKSDRSEDEDDNFKADMNEKNS